MRTIAMQPMLGNETKLRNAGLRPTRQRVALAEMLFCGKDCHVTAEGLHERARKQDLVISLATIYNTLNQFTEAGLLREVACEGNKSYFDTNTSNHYHFYIESDEELIDIPAESIDVTGLPTIPAGKKIGSIDVIVQLVDAEV